MTGNTAARSTNLIRSGILLGVIAAAAISLTVWKIASIREANAAAASAPEPAESVSAVAARLRDHRPTTTSIGTVLAPRSISLRNELAGTVHQVNLVPGRIVEAGTVLVALDVSVEEAELRALEAQAELARTTLLRMERMAERNASSAIDVDNARAERDVTLAQLARTKAIIARKTLRAPFRARVGISDVHPGQFLESGTLLTTLQGVEGSVNVDFAVTQAVASGLRTGDRLRVIADGATAASDARIVAVDSRVDPATRNTTVRASIGGVAPAPGASVRVEVPVGRTQQAVVVPVSALRKGPGGDHIFVLATDSTGATRAEERAVTSGAVVGDDVVILTGLKAGELVATSGSFKLRPGALVMVAQPAAQPKGAR